MVDFWIDNILGNQHIELVKGGMVHHQADLGGGRTGYYDANNRLLKITAPDTGQTTIRNLSLREEEKTAIDHVLKLAGRKTN